MSEHQQPEPRDVRAQREVALSREATAWELRVEKGWSQKKIAAYLGVTRQGVAKMLRRVERKTLATMQSQVALVKARQTAQLEHLAGELLEAWERSKKPGRKRKVATGPDGTTTTNETIGRDGDPRFIGHIVEILKSIRAIWGVGIGDEIDDPTGAYERTMAELRAGSLAGLSDDERRRRLAFSLRGVERRQRELEAEQARLAAEIGEDTP